MKTVILMRHAKSDWGDMTLRDFDRPVNGRGQRAAKLMGEWARRQGLGFDVILASPAVRVVDTLRHFMEGYGSCPEPLWDRRLYLAASSSLLDALHEVSAEAQGVMVMGHNPGLEDLILDLVPDDGLSALRGAVEEKFPTAAMAVLRCDAAHWKDVGPGAVLERFVRPRDLDPTLGPEG